MKYIAMALLASLVVACHHDGDVEELQGGAREAAIVLNVEGGSLGVETRASDIEDNGVESAIRHLDIMIFEDAEDDADKHLFYHQRATTASASGAVRLGVNIDDIVLGAKYWVYVVANSTLDVSTYANVGSVESLFDLEEELHNSHLTGLGLQNTPSHFLMDGCAYMGASEPAQAAAIVLIKQLKNACKFTTDLIPHSAHSGMIRHKAHIYHSGTFYLKGHFPCLLLASLVQNRRERKFLKIRYHFSVWGISILRQFQKDLVRYHILGNQTAF